MKVEMQGGPQDGQIYPHVPSSASWVQIPGWKVPIYYDSLARKAIAIWAEREKA